MESMMQCHEGDLTQMDGQTSLAIRKGIGETLRQTLPNDSRFPPRLQDLLEELHQRENDGERRRS